MDFNVASIEINRIVLLFGACCFVCGLAFGYSLFAPVPGKK